MNRNLPLAVILTFVTCGIYGLYWFVVLTDEVNRISMHYNDTPGVMALIFTIVTCGLYGIYWAYRLGVKVSEIKRNDMMARYGVQYGGDYGAGSEEAILYLLLEIFGLNLVVLILAQHTLNSSTL